MALLERRVLRASASTRRSVASSRRMLKGCPRAMDPTPTTTDYIVAAVAWSVRLARDPVDLCGRGHHGPVVTIRDAIPADIPFLAPIEARGDALFATVGHPEFMGPHQISDADAERAVVDGRVWVAELDGVVVGWLAARGALPDLPGGFYRLPRPVGHLLRESNAAG